MRAVGTGRGAGVRKPRTCARSGHSATAWELFLTLGCAPFDQTLHLPLTALAFCRNLSFRAASYDAITCLLRLEGGEIGSCRQQIIRAEVGDDGNHERSPGPRPVAVLHVIELARDIAW